MGCDEILTYGYIKPRDLWFSGEETPWPIPGWPGGSGDIPIGYARAHPQAKEPARDRAYQRLCLGLGGSPGPQAPDRWEI